MRFPCTFFTEIQKQSGMGLPYCSECRTAGEVARRTGRAEHGFTALAWSGGQSKPLGGVVGRRTGFGFEKESWCGPSS